MSDHLIEADDTAVELVLLDPGGLESFRAGASPATRDWIGALGFTAEPGTICPLPGPDGRIERVLAGRGDPDDAWAFAALAAKLPPGAWRLSTPLDRRDADRAALAWALGAYEFTRYKSRPGRDWPRLVWPAGADRPWVRAVHTATVLTRDLINTPAADLGPAELALAADTLAARFGATCRTIVGDGLLAENYPAIHAVGRAAAAARRPRLIDLIWGDPAAPKVTLVGKGVCFDSGGLDLKPSASMKLMKKDMGGAAHVLGLAAMIMDTRLPVRLRVLIPAVENAVSGDAMRPLDVLATRKGLRVEVGNTDAEGRLILADALAEASRERPALLIDVATLTGAARVALGPEIPALFCTDETLAAEIATAARAAAEPLWRLPLHRSYRRLLDSKVADLSSVSDGPHAGAITAALFLAEFVEPGIAWAHLDVFAWTPLSRPGRPEGGEMQGMRALFAMIQARFAH